MTRKEQIEAAASDSPSGFGLSFDWFIGFEDGAEWADANPNYTCENCVLWEDEKSDLQAQLGIAVETLEAIARGSFSSRNADTVSKEALRRMKAIND